MTARCDWVPEDNPLYVAYHDEEWGVPTHDDRELFELLTLEGAQAGLAWITILRKREAYRAAFAGFDPATVASFKRRDVERLMGNAGIVRNRLKIESAVSNAARVLEVQEELGSLDAYLWGFVDGAPLVGNWGTSAEVPAETAESRALSKDLKRRGFRFVGPTVCYALMQAAGLVDDHTLGCFKRTGRGRADL
ncbi:MAG: DNA-3-methyladenine glycosylase I [Thermoleophilia bacterium]